MEKLSTGALSSTPDTRDLVLSVSTDEVPDIVMLDTSNIKRIYQQQVGACTACALVKIIEQLYFEKTGVRTEFSTRFLYAVGKRFIEFNTTEGAQLRSMLKAAQKYGVLPEKDCPSDFSLKHEDFVNLPITPDMLKNALNWRIGAYMSIPVEESMIHYAVWKHKMLYARFEVGNKWFTPSWYASDILPLKPSETIISGHAVSVIGSECETDKETLLNSWSDRWADKGMGYYFLKDYKPTELWAVTLDPVPEVKTDNSPMVADGVWRSFLKYLREWKVIK